MLLSIFDPYIFEPFVFETGPAGESTTETGVIERKKSRGRTRGFLKADTKKWRKLFNAFESSASIAVTSFAPAGYRQHWPVESVRLQDLDADKLMAQAKEQIASAASKAPITIARVKKTMQVTSFKPKKIRHTGSYLELLTAARELMASAKQLMEKPSVPELEPTLYGYAPIYEYGEVEFEIDKRIHKEPDECDDYNGQVFSYGPDGLEDGAPIPPLHPNCGCVLRETKTRQIMYFPGSEWDTG